MALLRARLSDNEQRVNTQHSFDAYTQSTTDTRRPLRQLTLYIFLASILWIIIAIFTFIANQQKMTKLSSPDYTKYCCDCWNWAQTLPTHKIGWSYCIDDCTCNTCDVYNYNYTQSPLATTCNDLKTRNTTIVTNEDCVYTYLSTIFIIS